MLKQHEAAHKEVTDAVFSSSKPRWAVELFKEMYGIKL